jgi:Fe2+ transport system protein FeoA
MASLSRGKKGDHGEIKDLRADLASERRLFDLGFKRGAKFRIIEEAPFTRDPIVVEVNGVRIAVKRSILENVEV